MNLKCKSLSSCVGFRLGENKINTFVYIYIYTSKDKSHANRPVGLELVEIAVCDNNGRCLRWGHQFCLLAPVVDFVMWPCFCLVIFSVIFLIPCFHPVCPVLEVLSSRCKDILPFSNTMGEVRLRKLIRRQMHAVPSYGIVGMCLCSSLGALQHWISELCDLLRLFKLNVSVQWHYIQWPELDFEGLYSNVCWRLTIENVCTNFC